ncbi:unnamed protein product [marine sediment metagenome]|uniref:Uncharacterized protein n=1 Tax=marine sediment metagenome TaxID=412755 RepID=X1CB72_9ZZZZ
MVKENEALIHITITKTLKAKLKAIKKDSTYNTFSDFIREAIRDKMSEGVLNQDTVNLLLSEAIDSVKTLKESIKEEEVVE